MQRVEGKGFSDLKGINPINGKTISINHGSPSCPFTISCNATSTDKGVKEGPKLFNKNSVITGGKTGIRMVDSESRSQQWKVHTVKSSPNGNIFGCLKAGIGGSLQGEKDRGTMVKTRGKTTHKLIRVNGSKTSNFDFHTIISHDQLNSYSNGQYCGSNLFGKNGDTKNRDISVLSKEIWDYLLEKKITITAEYLPGKLNIQADQESQLVRDSSEWKLNPSIFRKK